MSKQWKIEDRVNALKATVLFKEVLEEDLEELVPSSRVIRLESGQILFSAGDPSQGLYVVLEGRTRAVRQGADGKEQVIHEDTPFSTFPEVAVFDDGPCPSSVISLEESVLLLLPKEHVRNFCILHPEVAMSALRVLSRRLRKATGMIEDLSLKDVSQRLAEFLLKQLQENSGRSCLELRYSNQEIADMIGTVREVVSRAFSKLQRKKWIRKDGRSVEILDRASLQNHVEGYEG
jgi:CRP/FNR family transcriptional regulator